MTVCKVGPERARAHSSALERPLAALDVLHCCCHLQQRRIDPILVQDAQAVERCVHQRLVKYLYLDQLRLIEARAELTKVFLSPLDRLLGLGVR